MRKRLLIMVFAGIMSLLMASAAFAAHSGLAAFGDSDRKGAATAGLSSFSGAWSTSCAACHESAEKHTTGPHGGYTASTNKCQTCHDVHAVEGNAMLLGGTTLTQACNFCHDLTGTEAGPFNKTNGMTVAAAHRVGDIDFGAYKPGAGTANAGKLDEYSWEDKAAITQIPGGNSQTLGNSDLAAYNQGQLSGTQYFTCDSCHTPHGVNTVAKYLGESGVKQTTHSIPAGTELKIYQTNRLLKSQPNENYSVVTQYGSEWCLTCHAGRDDTYGGIDAKHNHPVNETAVGYPFLQYAQADGKFLNGKNAATVAGQAYLLIDTTGTSPIADLSVDPRTNKMYAMTVTDWIYGAAGRPEGYDPIGNYVDIGPSCQQCHGSARDVEAAFGVDTNPERMSFPHISANKALLVETNDDFCTNCHDPQILP